MYIYGGLSIQLHNNHFNVNNNKHLILYSTVTSTCIYQLIDELISNSINLLLTLIIALSSVPTNYALKLENKSINQ